MPNDKNDVIIINLDRPRTLRFGHKAIKNMLAMTGKGLEEMDTENLDLTELEKIMYCGLLADAKENGDNLKLEDMEDLLDKAPNYNEIIEKMQAALQIAFGGFGDEGKNLKGIALEAQQKRKHGAGKKV